MVNCNWIVMNSYLEVSGSTLTLMYYDLGLPHLPELHFDLGLTDIDKQEFNLVPLDLKTFIDFYVFLLGIRFCTDFTLLRQA